MGTPGIKSSEFWTMLVTALVAAANERWVLGIPVETFAAPIIYIVSRGLAKWGTWDKSGN